MKKTIAFILAALLCLGLSACGGNDAELAAMQAQLDALSQQLSTGESAEMAALREAYEALLAENEALKSELAELKSSGPASYSRESITYPPSVSEAVKASVATEEFAAMQELFREFSGSVPDSPEVTRALRYQLEDFEGENMDCYLIEISADMAHWVNEAAAEGIVEYSFHVFVDAETGVAYDSIALDSLNYSGALSTDEDKAAYLLWIFANSPADAQHISFMNNTESISWLSEAEIYFLNEELK